MPEQLKLTIEKALDEIRPFLQNDGGDISLLSIEDGRIVRVQLEGKKHCNCVELVNGLRSKCNFDSKSLSINPQLEQK